MRIGEFRGAALPSASRNDPPAEQGTVQVGHFWDMSESDEEAGQDKLRSAVEWGIFHRFPRPPGRRGSLLNLKPSLGNGFFEREGASPSITVCPDAGNMPAWMADLPPESFDEIG